MTVYAPYKGQRLPAFMQGLLDTNEVLPINLRDVLAAVGDIRISDGISTGDQGQEISPANDALTRTEGQNSSQEAVAAAIIQRFFRKRYPQMKQDREFYQTDHGKIIRTYLDMFSVTIPEDQPQKITIRGHLLGKGAQLQIEFAAITEDLKSLREKMQSLIQDSKISPARLDPLIELRERMQTVDRSVSDLRSYWSPDTLRTQTWWLDVVKLEGELLFDATKLGQLKSSLKSILQEYTKQTVSLSG